MKYVVRLTSRADKDLRDIVEYIAFDLKAPESAAGQLMRLEDAISKLDHMPERFRRLESKTWKKCEVRVLPVDNYLVFYSPDVKDKVVTVIRVLYGGRNIEEELNG